MKLLILLGGPSAERGISLNSARSVVDHLWGDALQIDLIYFDTFKRPYFISRKMLYSNTPDDFDFKLGQNGLALSPDMFNRAVSSADLVFPVMHGEFGEDGQIQTMLEGLGTPYVGSGPEECRRAFDKFDAFTHLSSREIPMIPSTLCTDESLEYACKAFANSNLGNAAILKPARGGSSIGVKKIEGPPGLLAVACREMCAENERVVLQPYVLGIELTTVVLEGPDGPVALMPVQIDRHTGDILTFRHKYLPSNDVSYHCPPKLDYGSVQAVRKLAEDTFRALGLRDFARIDCWIDQTGRLLVSDINPISGLEQNSFLFIQAAQAGLSHRRMLQLILRAALRRAPAVEWQGSTRWDFPSHRQPVAVLFGGKTAERQVSVLSGANVWLKLLRSSRFEVRPYLLEDDDTVWALTYPVALRHSVEQIAEACRVARDTEPLRRQLAHEIARRLSLDAAQLDVPAELSTRTSLDEFLSKQHFVFIALHGGNGENGTLQRELDRRGIRYNGCGPECSRLCMDKYETGLRLAGLEEQGIHVARKLKLKLAGLADKPEAIWRQVTAACETAVVIVKPLDDGCSAGVVPLSSAGELATYLQALRTAARQIPPGAFSMLSAEQIVELPPEPPLFLLFERFVHTDDIKIVEINHQEASLGSPARLHWGGESDTGWIEITVGVIGSGESLRALTPSLTVAKRGVLSQEEKFMGGTGVNITPPAMPPLGRVLPAAIRRARELVTRVAKLLGIRGYARIDAFMHRESGEIIVIEANTLPGLTPSTVFYHQALEEDEPIYPAMLLERIIDLGMDLPRSGPGATAN